VERPVGSVASSADVYSRSSCHTHCRSSRYRSSLPSSRMRRVSPRYDLYVLLVVQAGFVARRLEVH
jgi:hypothetical protein